MTFNIGLAYYIYSNFLTVLALVFLNEQSVFWEHLDLTCPAFYICLKGNDGITTFTGIKGQNNLVLQKILWPKCWWVWHLCLNQRSPDAFQTKTILTEAEQHYHWMIGAFIGHRPRLECLGQWVFNCLYKVLQFQAGILREPVWMQEFREEFFTSLLCTSKCKPLASLGLSSICEERWQDFRFSSA